MMIPGLNTCSEMDLNVDLVLWSLFEAGKGTGTGDGDVFCCCGIPLADWISLVAWFSGVPASAASL